MNEEIEYAEMLEIPVSTVNIVKKKRGKKRKGTDVDLQESVIEKVNDKMDAPTATESAQPLDVDTEEGGSVDFYDTVDRVDTVRLYGEESEFEGGRYEPNEKLSDKDRITRIVIGAEFATVCALCGAIFLTNIFMPNSAINTFFRTLTTTQETVKTDDRAYSDFTLTSVVSDNADAELTLSETGVLTFTDDCLVYPAVDGKVVEIKQNEDGTYLVKLAHSDTFTGVISGLQYVYYQKGDEVKANIPVGYADGKTEVQVTMYSSGTLLNCFALTEENCLAWVAQE
jgi:hypothetical protein